MASLELSAHRVCLVALGVNSADELRPLVCLARGLLATRLGEQPTRCAIVTHPQYAEMLAVEGVGFLDGGPCPFAARSSTPEGRALDAPVEGGGVAPIAARLAAFMAFLTGQWVACGRKCLSENGIGAVVLASPAAGFVYPAVCEALNLGFCVLDSSPASKTAEFGPPRGFGSSQAGFRWVNQQRWDAHAKSMWTCLYRDGVNAARKSLLGLGPDDRELGPYESFNADPLVAASQVPVLLGYSEALLPRPLEWPGAVRIVGPLLPSPEAPPQAAKVFCDGLVGNGMGNGGADGRGGPSGPVVFVALGEGLAGVGSKEVRLRVAVAAVAACATAGARCVLVCPSGVAPEAARGALASGQPDGVPSGTCLVLSKRPPMGSELGLLERCAAVVCAGDPWTVHAGLRAGLPVCCVDFGRDDTPEAFWGARVAAAGVGPAPVALGGVGARGVKDLGALLGAVLAEALDEATGIGERARAMAGAMRRLDHAQGLAAAANATRQATAQLKPLGPPAPNAQPNAQPNTKPVAQQPAASQPKAVAAAAAASGGAPAAAAEAAPAAASGNGGGGGGAASVAAAAAESAKAASPEAVVAAAPAEGSADTRRAAGFSFSHRGVDAAAADASATNVWRRGDDAAFRVRTGPNYKKNGKKEPSGPSLYELVHMDLFKAPTTMEGMSDTIRFPHVPRDTHHPDVPPLIVINGILPLESPSMLSPSSDGPTLHTVFYFAIKQSTCDALASISTAPNAVKLLAEFCSRAQSQPDTFARFKCIGMVRNYEEAGMPSMFKSFNGKPVLVRNREAIKSGSGHMFRGPGFLELGVNIRTWPYLAKQGLGYLLSGADKCDLDVGFVVEGSADSELPEVLLGAARITKLNLKSAHELSKAEAKGKKR